MLYFKFLGDFSATQWEEMCGRVCGSAPVTQMVELV